MAVMRILVVDDEQGMREVCADTLARLTGIEVVLEANGQDAARRLDGENWDLLITDIRMPGMSGVDLLRLARERDPNLTVLMLTAYPTVETAVECMKSGAADYITKPFLPDELRATVARLLEHVRLRDENRFLRRHVERIDSMGEMIGGSAATEQVFELIRLVAATDMDVLIVGETGTGKELVARSVHQQSARASARFVPVDCGAIPEGLAESQFFGHERGAFTGAEARSLGFMEYADGGTLFLDEIGNLPVSLQAKLLRALQERRVRRVGSMSEIEVSVRVLAATSLDIEEEVQQGRFRADLYYRINVARIDLPPLRDRAEDIPLLVDHFLEQYARELKIGPVTVADEAHEVLANYPWPGNVRELQNILKRALLTVRDRLGVEDLPEMIVAGAGERPGRQRPGLFDLRQQRADAFEKEYLAKLLRVHEGDVAEVAREAQIPRGTAYRLIKKHGVNPMDFRAATAE